MPMRTVLPLLVAAAAAAMAGSAQSHATHAVAAIGDRLEVDDGILVEPVAVIDDSRCPASVMCMSAGRIVVEARIYNADRIVSVRLVPGAPVAVADGTLTLDRVTPTRDLTPIVPADYRFALSFAPAS